MSYNLFFYIVMNKLFSNNYCILNWGKQIMPISAE